MKLVIIIITVSFLHVSAASVAQQLTLKERDVTIDQVFKEIKKQTGYNILYSTLKIDDARKISVNFNNTNLSDVLDKCLEGQGLAYSIEDKTVLIREAEKPSLIKSVKEYFAAVDARGKVVDETGQPIPGATVRLKSGKQAVITDVKGMFVLKNVSVGEVVQITFIGFDLKELDAAEDMGVIKMDVATSKLDEVKVLAYSKTSERLSTGNTVSIKATDIAKSPVDNPILALKGRVPGLEITQNSGIANAGVTIRIQGQNSIGKGNDPFFVIDGVPYTSQLLPGISYEQGPNGSSPSPFGYGNPLAFINPSDIESIDVLKDAEATAIYGSRAANGAILITTKKGKSGDTKVEANVQSGWAQNNRRLKLMNTEQYLGMRLQAKANDNLPIGSGVLGNPDYDLLGKYGWSLDRTTDWQKELVGNTAHYTDAQLGISGGNSHTQFLVSGNFKRQTTVMPTDLADRKAAMHFSLNNNSTNQRLKFQLTGSYMDDQNELPSTNLTNIAQQLPPNAPSLYNADGTLNWALDENGNTTFDSPLRVFEIKSAINTSNLLANSSISYQLAKGLNLKSSFGYNKLNSKEIKITPLSYLPPAERENAGQFGRSSAVKYNQISSLNIDPQLTYQSNLWGGTFNAIFGGNYNRIDSKSEGFQGSGFSSDVLLNNLNAAANIVSNGNYSSQYRYAAAYVQVNYNLLDKYLLNLSARRDGSSRFGSANVLHDFGSISAAWLFSNESWVKNALNFLSYGKIKASYGTTGSDQIGEYQALSIYNGISRSVNYQNITTLQNGGLSNPYLQWELTKKMNIGLDLGFINDRILLNANYYRNRSSNQLLGYDLPATTGFFDFIQNFPATVQNSGLELSLNTINIKTGAFNWSTSLNLTVPKNKLVSFPGLETSSYQDRFIIGKPISIARLYHYKGVDPANGQYTFETKDGQVTSTPSDPIDRIVIADINPKYYAGLSNSLSFKGFMLDVLFQYVRQKSVSPGALGDDLGQGFFYMTDDGRFFGNQPARFLNAWIKPGDKTTYRAFSTDPFNSVSQTSNPANQSDGIYLNTSFLRLTNLSLAYQLPESILKKSRITSARIYAQGQNLWTLTGFNGLDPDGAFNSSLPPLRIFTLDLQITL